VQRCLGEHPAVRECAVLAVELPDKRMMLKAFVVMSEPVRDVQAAKQALQNYVKQKLIPYKYPRLIQFLPALPKTGTGKIDRQALLTGAVNIRQPRVITSSRSRAAPAAPRLRKSGGRA
jgi:acetyl-CoA synthetase